MPITSRLSFTTSLATVFTQSAMRLGSVIRLQPAHLPSKQAINHAKVPTATPRSRGSGCPEEWPWGGRGGEGRRGREGGREGGRGRGRYMQAGTSGGYSTGVACGQAGGGAGLSGGAKRG